MTTIKFLISFAAVTLALLSGYSPVLKSSVELQVSPGQTQTQARDPHSVSPLEIKRLIDESKRVWKKSGVVQDVDLGPTWKKLGIEDRFLQSCNGGSCEVKIRKADLDGQSPQELILEVTQYTFSRFLVFTQSRTAVNKAHWILRGYVDTDFNKYQRAQHRVLNANGRSWLAIRSQSGSGTGFSLYDETWYELGSDDLRPVLSYSIEGHTYPWPSGLGRSFRARVQPGTNGEVVVVYEVDYEAARYADKESRKLAVNRHRLCYTWDNNQRVFVFSAACSDTSEEEISAIANIETVEDDEGEQLGGMKFYSMSQQKAFVGGGYDVFLKYNFPVLMKIASSKSEAERDWLRQFLKDCDDTPKKTELLDALAKK